MSQPTYLTSGSRIAVVGAGPAGSFFAIELLRRARALGLGFRVEAAIPSKARASPPPSSPPSSPPSPPPT
jgi:hypothetical protein